MLCAKLGLPEGSDLSFLNQLIPQETKYQKKEIKGNIQVGKALSEWHKRRMLEHADIKTVMTK